MLMACVRLPFFLFNSCNASLFLLSVELNLPGGNLKDCHKVRVGITKFNPHNRARLCRFMVRRNAVTRSDAHATKPN